MLEFLGVPEQALGWSPLGLGVEDEPSERLCSKISYMGFVFLKARHQKWFCLLLEYLGVPEQYFPRFGIGYGR